MHARRAKASRIGDRIAHRRDPYSWVRTFICTVINSPLNRLPYNEGQRHPVDPQDKTLARRWQRGDRAAAQLAAERFAPALGAIAYGITRDASLAEDVVQETFVRATENIHRLRDESKLGSFLMTIARNAAHDTARRRKREVALTPGHDVALGDTDAAMQRRERAEAVRQAIETLPEDQREIVLMKYVSSMRYRDIAKALCMTEDAVAQKLLRIRRKLHEQLKEFQS